MSVEGKTICVDLDGVIHNYSEGFKDGSMYDTPINGAKDALAKLVSEGYRIVICTTRLNSKFDEENLKNRRVPLKNILNWLDDNGFKFDTHYHEVTNNKPAAFAYIDDRGVRFTNWKDILNYFV